MAPFDSLQPIPRLHEVRHPMLRATPNVNHPLFKLTFIFQYSAHVTDEIVSRAERAGRNSSGRRLPRSPGILDKWPRKIGFYGKLPRGFDYTSRRNYRKTVGSLPCVSWRALPAHRSFCGRLRDKKCSYATRVADLAGIAVRCSACRSCSPPWRAVTQFALSETARALSL